MPSSAQAVKAQVASSGQACGSSSPEAMKKLMPLPTCWPEMRATMAGAVAWNRALLIPVMKSSRTSAA
jgi:hypothetical protein